MKKLTADNLGHNIIEGGPCAVAARASAWLYKYPSVLIVAHTKEELTKIRKCLLPPDEWHDASTTLKFSRGRRIFLRTAHGKGVGLRGLHCLACIVYDPLSKPNRVDWLKEFNRAVMRGGETICFSPIGGENEH